MDTCTADEKMLIEKWLLFYKASEATDLTETDFDQLHKEVWQGVEKNTIVTPLTRRLWTKIAAAAVLLLAFSFGMYWFATDKGRFNQRVIVVNDITPGKNKAYLTLADGKRIALTDAANGKLVREGGVQITKTADGQLVYEISSAPGRKDNTALNTIETPRGGQYQIRLPDGTKVWLNAASKLIYPLSFASVADRKVVLSGEAYFEVAKDKTHPFLVESAGQTVKVLGTHFNINSYTDEGDTKTTLLEGSVKVTTLLPLHPASLAPLGRGGKAGEGEENTSLPTGISPQSGERGLGTILKPGQQASLKNNKIKVTQVNPENTIAWKNGEFEFANEPLESIMRKVSRWYDVEIIYQNKDLKNEIFSGGISRFELVSDVLKKLSLTEVVRFKIEGRRIFVMK